MSDTKTVPASVASQHEIEHTEVTLEKLDAWRVKVSFANELAPAAVFSYLTNKCELDKRNRHCFHAQAARQSNCVSIDIYR